MEIPRGYSAALGLLIIEIRAAHIVFGGSYGAPRAMFFGVSRDHRGYMLLLRRASFFFCFFL